MEKNREPSWTIFHGSSIDISRRIMKMKLPGTVQLKERKNRKNINEKRDRSFVGGNQHDLRKFESYRCTYEKIQTENRQWRQHKHANCCSTCFYFSIDDRHTQYTEHGNPIVHAGSSRELPFLENINPDEPPISSKKSVEF